VCLHAQSRELCGAFVNLTQYLRKMLEIKPKNEQSHVKWTLYDRYRLDEQHKALLVRVQEIGAGRRMMHQTAPTASLTYHY